MKSPRTSVLVVLAGAAGILALILAPGLVAAQPQPPGNQVAEPVVPGIPAKAGGDAEGDKLRFPDAKEVTKDMNASEGLFTLYRFDPTDKKRDPEKLLAKIPRNLLGEDLLLAMSMSRGRMAGFMWGDALVRWEIAGKQLRLLTPNLRYVRKAGQPVSEAVERTYNDSFMAAVPIVGMTQQGDVIIDLEPLLKSDLAGITDVGGRIQPELSTWRSVKAFPDNILIDVNMAMGEKRGGHEIGITYDFRRLPKLGAYSPRLADPRIGYFLTAKMDWSKKYQERENFDRYIHRWKLEKQDPALELSPPKEPIVFIIEQSVPIQWRRWVREGIEDWNKAYEKIGFVGAVIVQQQTDDNEYKDYDPEDARYNFIRWGVTGQAFAMGPSRVDPRTGQILDADILFDDSFVRAWMYNFDLYGPTALAQVKGPGFQEYVQANPDLVPTFLATQKATADDPDQEFWTRLQDTLEQQGYCACSYAWGMQQQLALGYNAMIATGTGPKKLPERFIGEAIKEIVTHEVGHTLGLRHNFKGSSWLNMDEIQRRRLETDEPSTASIMDYNPLLFFAGDDLEKCRHFVTPTIGPYDDWAIAYGYAIAEGKPEADMLKEIARRGAEPALQYATDEDTSWIYSPDPLVNRYDLSSNPIDYSRARMALTEKLLKNITEWAVQDGEPMYYLRRAFDVIWFERFRNMSYVARTVGGQYFNRDNRGDPDARPPFVLVDPAQQRAALDFLAETVFNDEFYMINPEVLNSLAPTRWSHWGSEAPTQLDYPMHERIRTMQVSTLLDLLAPPVLQRVYEAELKSSAADKFTAAELITTLRDKVWRQLDSKRTGTFTDAEPYISSISRNLQQDHLFMLLSIAQGRPGATMSKDLHAMVTLALAELSAKIGHTLEANKLDFASKAHLTECKSRIDRILNAPLKAE
jgi:hypothetical protein